jgi:hypothetical protein
VSRKQPVGRQEQAQPDQEREPVVAGSTRPGRLGGSAYQGLDHPAEVPPLDAQAGRAQSEYCHCPQPAGTGLRDIEDGTALPGTDPRQMHALEKAKLVRHHAKRVRQLGADEQLTDEMVTRLNQTEACSSADEKQATSPQPEVIRRACPAKSAGERSDFALA